MQHHKYSLTEVENMMPWEKGDICSNGSYSLLKKKTREENERQTNNE